MLEFLSENWGTIVVAALLALALTAAVIKLVRDKRSGKGSCCGDCSKCHSAESSCKKRQ